MNDRANKTFSETPVNQFLGTTLVERTPEHVTLSMPVRQEMLQETGVVQGGLLSALADTAAVYLLIPEALDVNKVTSVEFKMNFLGPANPGQGDLLARSSIIKRGRRVAVFGVDVTQDDRAVAYGVFTYLLYE
jgi:uncharacterized protein (TIGR00369 family)